MNQQRSGNGNGNGGNGKTAWFPFIGSGNRVFVRSGKSTGISAATVDRVKVLTFETMHPKWVSCLGDWVARNEGKVRVINLDPSLDPKKVDGVMLWVGMNVVLVYPGKQLDDRAGHLVDVVFDNDAEHTPRAIPRPFVVAMITETNFVDRRDDRNQEPGAKIEQPVQPVQKVAPVPSAEDELGNIEPEPCEKKGANRRKREKKLAVRTAKERREELVGAEA